MLKRSAPHASPKTRARNQTLTLRSLLINGSSTLFSYVKYGWFTARLSDHN